MLRKTFFLIFYLFIHERQREREREKEREAETQQQKQAPCRELDVGLDPSIPGSCPEPKADAQPLSHPGVSVFGLFTANVDIVGFRSPSYYLFTICPFCVLFLFSLSFFPVLLPTYVAIFI